MSGPGEQTPGHEGAPSEQPRIYVASLSDYNAGILHGTWLDAASGVEDLQAGIDGMLAASPTTRRYGEPAEEWAIHDYEHFGRVRVGEWESIERINTVARGIVSHGEAFAAWWANDPPEDLDEVEEAFEQAHQGHWSSMAAYGEELLEDLGVDLDRMADLPEQLRAYLTFDVDGWVRDMEIGGEIYAAESGDGGVYVFWNR